MLDEKMLDGLSAGDLFQLLAHVVERIKRADAENPEEEGGPVVGHLLRFADAITRRLDPLVRQAVAHDPAALAEWEELSRQHDALAGRGEEPLGADVESSTIS